MLRLITQRIARQQMAGPSKVMNIHINMIYHYVSPNLGKAVGPSSIFPPSDFRVMCI